MAIHSRLPDAGRHALVPLALGLIAAGEKLGAALIRNAEPGATLERVATTDTSADARRDGTSAEPPLDADDPFVLAALGAIALRRTLDGWLATATHGDARNAHDAQAAPHPLRRLQDLTR